MGIGGSDVSRYQNSTLLKTGKGLEDDDDDDDDFTKKALMSLMFHKIFGFM